MLTSLEDGYSQTFPVEIVEYSGFTIGGLEIYDVPFGTYELTEVVPEGYEAAGFDLNAGSGGEGVTLTFELGVADQEVLFVNVPLGEQPPATPPSVTPPTNEPVVTPQTGGKVTVVPTRPAVAVLPSTGYGSAPDADDGSTPFILLGLVIAGTALGVVAVRRYRRTA